MYGFIRDISERRRGEEHLVHMAYHDALTGLPNRILVEQELDLRWPGPAAGAPRWR